MHPALTRPANECCLLLLVLCRTAPTAASGSGRRNVRRPVGENPVPCLRLSIPPEVTGADIHLSLTTGPFISAPTTMVRGRSTFIVLASSTDTTANLKSLGP